MDFPTRHFDKLLPAVVSAIVRVPVVLTTHIDRKLKVGV